MPKILINEKDKTSSGTPGSYANFSVLVTGFSTGKVNGEAYTKTLKEDLVISPDANGVYEFSSADDFKKVTGEADSDFKIKSP